MIYYLLKGGRLLILFCLASLCLCGVWLFLRCNKKYMLEEIGNALRPELVKGKRRLLLLALAFSAVALAVKLGNELQYGSLLIALTYPEASVGLNPDGSRYNMSNILCDEVLERATASGNLGKLKAEDLKTGLKVSSIGRGRNVESVQPEDILAGTSADKTDGLVSTQFLLRFFGTSKTEGLHGQKAVRAVARAYQDWFRDECCNTNVLEISFDDREGYDYPELKDYFTIQLKKICTLTNAYYMRDGAFVSEQTGESFLSLNTKSWDMISTRLEALDSFVLSHGLSKDVRAYMDKLRYEHILQCRQYLESIRSYQVRLDAVRRFDSDMSTVMYIPTFDSDNAFYMSKTKIGIDYFSMEADQYSDGAATVLDSILSRKYLLQMLNQGPDDEDSYERVDQMTEEIEEQILSLSQVVTDTVLDYENSRSNGYVVVSEAESSPVRSYWKLFILIPVFFALLYWNTALGELYWKTVTVKGGSTK